MKVVLALLAASGVLWPAKMVFDCRYYDCVTPFQRPLVPLPPGSSIPQPSWWPPPEIPGGPPLAFVPLKATSTGFVFGTVSNYPGFFLTDGTNTGWTDAYPDFHFVDISDGGSLFYWDNIDVPRTATWNLAVRSPLNGGPIPGPYTDSGGFFYRIGSSGPGLLKVNGGGDVLLIAGMNRFDAFDNLLETGLTVMAGNPGFSPAAIPEPATIGLLGAGLLVTIVSRRRPS